MFLFVGASSLSTSIVFNRSRRGEKHKKIIGSAWALNCWPNGTGTLCGALCLGSEPHSPQQLPSKKEKGNAWGMFLHYRSQVWLEDTPAAIKTQVKLDFVSISMFR